MMPLPSCDFIHIHGAWKAPIAPGEPIRLFNPVTEQQIGTVTSCGPQDVAPAPAQIIEEAGTPPSVFKMVTGTGDVVCMGYVRRSCSAPTLMLVPQHRLAEVEQLAVEAANSREYGRFRLEEYLETKAILGFFPQ